jgi:gliding motility-associated-like protein
MYFDPVVAGPGSYQFQYTWNNGAGCVDSEIKTITVTNPYSFTSLTYTTICKSTGGTVNPTLNGTSGGTYSSGTLGASLNTATGVVNIATAPVGTHTVNYSVGTMPCGATGSGTITITDDPTVTPASSSPTVCINTAITNITHTTTGATGIGAATGLPAGVSANWSGNTITISGTPTASGTFNYSIPLTAGCGAVNATGTITVTPNNTVTPASSSPTVCINTAITNITHTTTGATGIGAATGLPAGVSANWSGNTITISGTPTASGTFNYSIPLTGGCGTVNATGTITVTPNNTVTPASSSPTVCINTAITNITHTTTGATGIGAATGLPAGVSANWSGNTITISGTPTASGTFNYSIPLTGGCGTVNATGTITVTPNNTVTPASSSPTVCINNVMTNITHTTTGATGIGAATGLPAGVSANWSGNTITISGIPTASGTFNYSIPLTGGCGTVNATGTITVTPNNTVTPASSSPTVCINNVMTNITHTTTGATGIGAATGLPAGVSANWSGNTITISGIPTASGTFNYSIPLTGGCGTVNATGTITVNPDMTVTPASSSPTVCINTAITNITHTTTGATAIGAATGLPAGVSAGFAGNTITISGTPTASGTFNYSIPLTGGCGTVNATGTITVTPNNTVTPASSSPTVCINTAITNITHTTTGATGIGAATGLPAGVSAGFAGNTITISGTPTASGTFNYSIPLTGGCGTVNATGTITVNPDPTINITTASECENIPGSGEALNIDVTALGTAINATANITWYTDNTYTTSYNPTNETVSNGEVFYFEVELNGCIVQGTITYSVSGNIVLNDPAPEFCEDVLGGGSVANVDLTTFNNSVFAGASSYTWATGPTGVTINNGDSINVQVQQGSCPTVDIFVHFTVNPLPTATISGSDTICAGDAIPDVTITLTGTGPWSVTYTDGTTPVTINPATSPATLSGLADGTYTITAVSDNNCTGTFSGSATILTNPLPTATISGGGTICAGDAIPDATITLTGTGPWSVTYTDGTTPVTINPATSPVTLSGLADGTYTVTTVSDNNCTGTFSGSATILTNPLPTAIDQNPQVCEDASTPGSAAGVDLTTLNSSIDGGAGNTLTWYTDAGLTLPVGTPTNTTVNDNDVFYVLVDNGTCSDTAVVTYDVTSTITLNAQTPSLCEDAVGSGTVANVDLTSYNNAIYSGGATFDWYQDAGLTTPVATPTAVTVTNGLTLYVDVTDGNCNNSSTITFTINPIFFVQESTNICSGASYTFPDGTTQTNITAQVIYNSNLTTTLGCDSIIETTVNVNPTYNIQETVAVCSGGSYTFPDGTTQTNITTQVVYNSNLTTTLGCDSIVETTVNVNPLPIVVLPSGGMVCVGSTINLTPSTGGTWSSSDPTVATIDNSGLVTGIATGTTTVVFTDAITGCSSNTTDGLITVNPIPTINVPNAGMVCEGSTINLTPSTGGTWSSSNPTVATIDNSGLVTGVSVGSANMLYTDAITGCSNTIASGLVIVGGVTAAITATPTSGFMPLDVVFGNNSSTGPTVNYAWVFGDGTANSNQFEPTHTYTNLGNYTATLIVTDGVCFDTATVVIEVIGQSTILIPNVFTPNGDGSNDVFTVEGTNLESVEGEIFNRWGQKMFGWNGVRGYWDGRTQAGSEAPDGTYFYIIKAKGMDDVEYFKKGGFSLIR